MKAAPKNQVLEKTNIACLYRSADSGIYYGLFKRNGVQVKRSLKTTDKELARRQLEDLRQRVGRLNSKAGTRKLAVASARRFW
jgi:hypothetical protein